MSSFVIRTFMLLIATTIVAGLTMKQMIETDGSNVLAAENHSVPDDAQNPLLAKWEGKYGGVPPFDRVQVPLFKPALEVAMAEELSEVDRIATNLAPATFENTVEALERAGRTLNRVQTVYGVWAATMNGPEFQDPTGDGAEAGCLHR